MSPSVPQKVCSRGHPELGSGTDARRSQEYPPFPRVQIADPCMTLHRPRTVNLRCTNVNLENHLSRGTMGLTCISRPRVGPGVDEALRLEL